MTITSDKELYEKLHNDKKGSIITALKIARSRAAMAQPTQFPARGSWVNARIGRSPGYRDRGNPGSLIG